ncbi:hypothetical protein BKN14_03600 [Candidatus Gracilibacteria bacterium HOT-871]|nr:hypothetical protein BKN14_03600 [Candidatus Gracilibacteria bacterium HOT-871]MBB1564744.1 hypothetical protein [Candidatus Gracilibacteria bacterium]RKW23250.1 MAG: hypothetical protein D8B46_03650 [Candidatus Gracilibacteria bacterium]
MKKILVKIITILGLSLICFGNIYAAKGGNTYLEQIQDTKRDLNVGANENELLLNIAISIINILFIISIVYFFIIAIKLIANPDSDQESGNFKKGILWTSLGLMVIQMARVFVNSLYINKKVQEGTIGSGDGLANMANNLLNNIIKPLTDLLETGASFLFIMIAIFAFYKLVTSNGDDGAAKSGKMMVAYAIIGFIIIKVSATLVKAVYGECTTGALGIIINSTCNHTANISGVGAIITNIINWLNSFIGVGVIIMVIYAGLQIIFSKGDEDKISSGKKSITYILIGIGILVMNYLILTFFLKV